MAKRKKTDTVDPSGYRCMWADCREPGDYRAPKSRANLREYQWFCAEHIAQFNKNWNYFEGMSTDEIYDFQRDATTGHRPTWRMDQAEKNATAKLEAAFHQMFGGGQANFKANARPIPARDRDALALLDLEHPTSKKNIKRQYRELVKKHHPDVNIGNPRAEETFKRLTAAYHHLMTHYVEI